MIRAFTRRVLLIIAMSASILTFGAFSRVSAYELYELYNMFTNGDFSTDTNGDGLADGWTNANSATYSIVDGKQKFGWTAGSYYGGITAISITAGHKYYLSAEWYQNSSPDKYYIQIFTGSLNNTFYDSVDWAGSTIITSTYSGTQLKFYQDAYCGAGDYMTLDNLIIVDLTLQFGSGREPSLSDFETLYMPDMDYFETYSSFWPETYTPVNSGSYTNLGTDLTSVDYTKSVVDSYGDNIDIEIYAYFYDSDNYTGAQNALYYAYNNHATVQYGTKSAVLDWGSYGSSERQLQLVMTDDDETLIKKALFDRNINTDNFLQIDALGRNADDVQFYMVLSSTFDLRVDIQSFLISYQYDIYENDFTIINDMIIKCTDRFGNIMLPALWATMDDGRTFVIDDIGSAYTDVSAFNFEFKFTSPAGDDDSDTQTLYLYELGVFSSSNVVFGDYDITLPLPFEPGVCDWYEFGCQAKNTANDFVSWFYEKLDIEQVVGYFDEIIDGGTVVLSLMPDSLVAAFTIIVAGVALAITLSILHKLHSGGD